MRSDRASIIWLDIPSMWTACIDTPYRETLWLHGNISETLWPQRQYMLIYSDHVNGMDWYNILWCARWYEPHWLTLYYDTCDEVDTMDRHNVSWPYGQYMVIHSDHMSNIWWYTLTTWATCDDPFWPHEQYMVIHSDHVNNMNWYNISWDTLTTWATYGDTIWPHGQYELIQHIVRHSDHVGNISWSILTTWAIYGDPFWPCEPVSYTHLTLPTKRIV